jgi:hypothetical protein
VKSVVTLYSRPGCHLCEQAREEVLRARARVPFELVEIDIEGDPELHRRYLERIPVVAVDGDDRFDLFVDQDALITALSSAAP